MKYKHRVIKHLKLLFSKQGYNTAFNKDYPGFEDCIIPNEKIQTTGEGYFLSIEYIIIAASIILSIASLIFTGSEALIYIPLIFTSPIVLVLIINTIKIRTKIDKYRKDKGTSDLLFLSFLSIPSSCMIGIFLGLIENNILSGVGFIIMTSYPWLLMLCRINVFSNDSIPRYEGPKMSIELGPGYVPIVYWLLSVQIGFAVTKAGFKNLQISLASGDPSLFFCLTAIMLGLISQSIVVSPDIINKIVPVDMRMKRGYVLMVILTIVLVFVSWAVMDIL